MLQLPQWSGVVKCLATSFMITNVRSVLWMWQNMGSQRAGVVKCFVTVLTLIWLLTCTIIAQYTLSTYIVLGKNWHKFKKENYYSQWNDHKLLISKCSGCNVVASIIIIYWTINQKSQNWKYATAPYCILCTIIMLICKICQTKFLMNCPKDNNITHVIIVPVWMSMCWRRLLA